MKKKTEVQTEKESISKRIRKCPVKACLSTTLTVYETKFKNGARCISDEPAKKPRFGENVCFEIFEIRWTLTVYEIAL